MTLVTPSKRKRPPGVTALSIEVEKKPVEYRASCGASSCAVVVLVVKIYRERLCLTVLGAVEPTLYPGDVPHHPSLSLVAWHCTPSSSLNKHLYVMFPPLVIYLSGLPATHCNEQSRAGDNGRDRDQVHQSAKR